MNKAFCKKMEDVRLRLDFMALSKDLNIANIAREAGISRSHMVRSFKKVYKQSPLEYCHSVRLRRVIDLLREDKYIMKEIADMVGISSIYHFSRWFKDKTGKSPTQYDLSECAVLRDY